MKQVTQKHLTETFNRLQQLAKDHSMELSPNNKEESLSVLTEYNSSISTNCEICNNQGHIFYEENGVTFGKECDCMFNHRNRIHIEKSGLNATFENYTFDKYKAVTNWQKFIKNKALQFLNASKQWFYIGGAVGSGKSHICTAICCELIKKKTVHYMPWRDEIVKIKANVNNDVEYQKLISRPKNIDVLYIDDFFKGKVSEADHNVAFEILNYRYNNKTTTIISSEYDIDTIIKINEAVGSRIFQMTKANNYSITIPADDNKNYRLHPL